MTAIASPKLIILLGEIEDTPAGVSIQDVNTNRLRDDSDMDSVADAYIAEEEKDTTDAQELAQLTEQKEHRKPERLQEKSDKQEQNEQPEAESDGVTAAASRCEHFNIIYIHIYIYIFFLLLCYTDLVNITD